MIETMIEISAVLMTLLCVYQLNRKKVIGWVYGILGAALFFIVFIQEDLFFQSGLQIVYLIQSVYGWWVWKQEDNLEPKMMNNWGFITHILLVTGLALSVIPYLNGITSFLDVLTTLLALLATYYLSKKIIQSWYLWTLINVLLMALFITQGLWIATAMEVVLLIIAIEASFSWRRNFKFKELVKTLTNEKN